MQIKSEYEVAREWEYHQIVIERQKHERGDQALIELAELIAALLSSETAPISFVGTERDDAHNTKWICNGQ